MDAGDSCRRMPCMIPLVILRNPHAICVRMIVTLTLWLVWKAHPGLGICAAFWLSVIWIIHSKSLTRHSAGLVVLFGVVLNAVVTELNDGVMPVVGMPKHFHAASPIWQTAQTSSYLLVLADKASLHFFSIGDLMLIAGASMLLLGTCVRQRQSSAADAATCRSGITG
jgi:hypothetical protein